MAEALKCEQVVTRELGLNNQGRMDRYHAKCGAPASEVEVGGMLARAKAILCAKHKAMADRELFTSANGYPDGKISESAQKKKYKQQRLPGTGVIGGGAQDD